MPTPSGPVVIAGGSGYLGQSLARRLADSGLPVVILSRSPPVAGPWTHTPWDARTLGAWAAALDGAAALVNLVGRTVDCVKTPDHCDEILRSRVEATRALGDACRAVAHAPPVWVQMSTAHIVGDPPSVVCDEMSPPGYGLAPQVGLAWEAAFWDGLQRGQRGVVLRTSFVIGPPNAAGSGALGRLRTLARFGLGGAVGSGRQGISWIHQRDFNRIAERAIRNAAMEGVYIASAPNPVSNREFMRELRRAIGVPIGLPAAEWMVRIGAPLLLRTDPELALYGRFVVPARLLAERFRFEFPSVREALADIYRRPPRAGAADAP
jgi:uncharacterized protein (TIGR01777 family)